MPLMSEDAYKKHWPHCQLQKSDVGLNIFCRASGDIGWPIEVLVQYGEQQSQLLLIVKRIIGQVYLGELLKVIRLDW